MFTYTTETLETDLQQAKLDLERKDTEMENLKTQIAQLEKEKKELQRISNFPIQRRFRRRKWI